MRKMAAGLGWTLRASALVCIVWIVSQVATGQMTALSAIVSAAAWHGVFAATGVALVGASKRDAGSESVSAT